jgi:hypothetical protein
MKLKPGFSSIHNRLAIYSNCSFPVVDQGGGRGGAGASPPGFGGPVLHKANFFNIVGVCDFSVVALLLRH